MGFELAQSKIVLVIGVVLLIAFIGFLAFPKTSPEGKHLGTQRLVKLVNVPVVSFAGEGEPTSLTADAIACSTGEIVAREEDCGQFMQEQLPTCDGTLEALVCGEEGVTYLNSCYAESEGVNYVDGLCESTAADLEIYEESFGNETDSNSSGDAFSAHDGLTIFGQFYPSNGENGVVLLHMFSKNHTSYASFAAKLQAAGFNVLAIDLRGHGQSRDTLQFETMTEQDFRNMQQDVDGAVRFMRTTKGIDGKVFLVGASIGANTAINYGSVNAQPAHGDSSAVVNGIVALSPSFNYEGIVTQGVESSFSLPILTISSKGETQIHEDAVALHNAYNVEDKELIALEGDAHGTDFLPAVEERLIAWLLAH